MATVFLCKLILQQIVANVSFLIVSCYHLFAFYLCCCVAYIKPIAVVTMHSVTCIVCPFVGLPKILKLSVLVKLL